MAIFQQWALIRTPCVLPAPTIPGLFVSKVKELAPLEIEYD